MRKKKSLLVILTIDFLCFDVIFGITCPGFPGYCSESFPGQTCVVVCSRGRNNVPLCQEDGTWTDIPRCVEHEPGVKNQIPGICPGISGYCSEGFYGYKCNFLCPTGPHIHSVCTIDGTWEPYPICEGDIRETQDGCNPCPGPLGSPRNRSSEPADFLPFTSPSRNIVLNRRIIPTFSGNTRIGPIVKNKPFSIDLIAKTPEPVPPTSFMSFDVHSSNFPQFSSSFMKAFPPENSNSFSGQSSFNSNTGFHTQFSHNPTGFQRLSSGVSNSFQKQSFGVPNSFMSTPSRVSNSFTNQLPGVTNSFREQLSPTFNSFQEQPAVPNSFQRQQFLEQGESEFSSKEKSNGIRESNNKSQSTGNVRLSLFREKLQNVESFHNSQMLQDSQSQHPNEKDKQEKKSHLVSFTAVPISKSLSSSQPLNSDDFFGPFQIVSSRKRNTSKEESEQKLFGPFNLIQL